MLECLLLFGRLAPVDGIIFTLRLMTLSLASLLEGQSHLCLLVRDLFVAIPEQRPFLFMK